MEVRHERRAHATPHEHGHPEDHDWSDEGFVAQWIERQEAHAPQRRPSFAKVRSLIPKGPTQAFRYLNLGAGSGELDELILDRFTGARAVLLDSSMPMLAAARKRLERFEERVEYVRADLSNPSWVSGAAGPLDVVVSTRAVHHIGEAGRIRALFGEILGTLGHGGLFINLDHARLARAEFQELGAWAAVDPEAGFEVPHSPHVALPSSVEEQLGWLREVGFAAADCVYREFQVAILVGLRDHIHWPEGMEPKPSGADPHEHHAASGSA